MGLFRAAHGCGGEKASLSKIFHTYTTMMQVGTVIPYLNIILKICEPHNAPLKFCWHHHFLTGNQQI